MRRTGGGPAAPGSAATLLRSIADAPVSLRKTAGPHWGELQTGLAAKFLLARSPLTLAVAGPSASATPGGIVQHTVVCSAQHNRMHAVWNAAPKHSSAANIQQTDRHAMERLSIQGIVGTASGALGIPYLQ